MFIDDDTVHAHYWLESVVYNFSRHPRIAGVSGPSIIHPEFRINRDIFRFRFIKNLYDFIFLEGRSYLPGHITRAGAWTTGACDDECNYEGEVDFLEACNMAFRRDVFFEVGGFDESFKGIGDWSEPDLSFRIRRAGYKLQFSRNAKLYHRPSKSGAYKKRLGKCSRMENYLLFSRRWIKPCFQHYLYKQFLRSYYFIKEQGWLD